MDKVSVTSPTHISCMFDPFLLWDQCPQVDLLKLESSQPETAPHVEAEVVLGQLLGDNLYL